MTIASGPTVSVLMPCYNADRYIGAALDSVLAQTWPDLEIIVVDDGSSDSSRHIVDGYAARGVSMIVQANAGAAAARNCALSACSGTFVLFLDADDVIASSHIEALHAAIVGSTRCVAVSQWDRFRTSIGEATFPRRSYYRNASGVDWLLENWAIARPMLQPGMFLIPRALLIETGGWDERLSLIDDFEFFARVISKSSGVRFASDARLCYRSAIRDSLSGRKGRADVKSAYLSVLLGTGHLLNAEDSVRTRLVCANLLQDFEYTYYPDHTDLRADARARIAELGGSDLTPEGPPGFQKLRRIFGWRAARHAQRLSEKWKLNGASRSALGR